MASSSSSIALIRLYGETTRISLVLILSKDTQLKGTLPIKTIPWYRQALILTATLIQLKSLYQILK